MLVPDTLRLELCLVVGSEDLGDWSKKFVSLTPGQLQRRDAQLSFHCPSYPFKMVFLVDIYCKPPGAREQGRTTFEAKRERTRGMFFSSAILNELWAKSRTD